MILIIIVLAMVAIVLAGKLIQANKEIRYYELMLKNSHAREDQLMKNNVIKVTSTAGMIEGMAVTLLDEKGVHRQGIVLATPKLNKDGSIAKKRGRKSNVKTT